MVTTSDMPLHGTDQGLSHGLLTVFLRLPSSLSLWFFSSACLLHRERRFDGLSSTP
jgi:hypothetical protein